jgi:hypothetical protein
MSLQYERGPQKPLHAIIACFFFSFPCNPFPFLTAFVNKSGEHFVFRASRGGGPAQAASLMDGGIAEFGHRDGIICMKVPLADIIGRGEGGTSADSCTGII